MIDAQTLEPPTETATIQSEISTVRRARRWTPGACVWCGDDDAVEIFRNEPRCATCREHESVIEEARRFVGTYGLRPIGGTLQSDDEEEYEHRLAARDARRTLNEIRLDEQPDPALVRKALRPRAAAVVAEKPDTRAPRATTPTAAPRRTRPATPPAAAATTSVDIDEIQTRALALLDQLSAIDAQLEIVAEQNGLAARARRSDLEKQKATILRTLAALEKARLSAASR
ncbi:hypothetical protein [Rhodococcus yananensis]|uniref:hypothetical protein n=1 Tax=Rhodococcus yananensis TaxID=2879464 RepID=UPI001CF916B1|nr:hypothetical protein [Rhodococcus yananensis]